MHNMPWTVKYESDRSSVVDSSGRPVCDDELYYPLAVDLKDQRIIAAMSRVCVAAKELQDIEKSVWEDRQFSTKLLRAKAKLATALAELEALE